MIFLFGCQTSKYKAGNVLALGTDIVVTRDRIILECEFVNDYDGIDYKEPHGFMIYILDNEKTVLTVSSSTLLNKKDCFDWLQKADKIINNGRSILIRTRGDAYAPVNMDQLKYKFTHHGTYNGNGRSLNFLGIRNNLGQCLNVLANDNFCSEK